MSVKVIMSIDYTKPYCGNCGVQGVPLRYLRSTPDGDRLHVCKDARACHKRLKANLAASKARRNGS